jgi:hypothetical protein
MTGDKEGAERASAAGAHSMRLIKVTGGLGSRVAKLS